MFSVNNQENPKPAVINKTEAALEQNTVANSDSDELLFDYNEKEENPDFLSALAQVEDIISVIQELDESNEPDDFDDVYSGDDFIIPNSDIDEEPLNTGEISEIVNLTLSKIESLNEKYNLNLDTEHPENITQEQLDTLEKLKFVDSLPETFPKADEYFTTLGWIDMAYDTIKSVFPGLTKENIVEYAEKEKEKKDILANCVINGGKLEIGDKNSETTVSKDGLTGFIKDTMSCLTTFDAVRDYAAQNLGIDKQSTIGLLEDYILNSLSRDIALNSGNYSPETIEATKIVKNEKGEYIISSPSVFDDVTVSDYLSGTCDAKSLFTSAEHLKNISDILIDNSDLKEGKELTFDELYSAFTGVKYDEEAVSNLNKITPVYEKAVEITKNAFEVQNALKNATPYEAYEYFQKIADNNADVTASQLFNQYYSDLMAFANTLEDNPLENCGDAQGGLKLKSLTIDDNGLITETFDIIDADKFEANQEFWEDFYTYDSKTGSVTRTYNTDFDKVDDNEGYEAPIDTKTFLALNNLISDNNLYLKSEKNSYNAKFDDLFEDDAQKPDMFAYVMSVYPQMRADTLGVNTFDVKISEYIDDMDTYTSKFADVISKAGFVMSWIPGMQAVGILSLVGSYSDNFMDAVNILSSDDKDKEAKMSKLLLSTGQDLINTAAGFGINKIASIAGSKLMSKYLLNNPTPVYQTAKAIRTAGEYGVDVLASMGWDIASYIVQTGEIPDADITCKMFAQNLIFNSGDLRGGMALFRAMQTSDPEVSIGIGKTVSYNDDGSIIYKQYDKDNNIVYVRSLTGSSVTELNIGELADKRIKNYRQEIADLENAGKQLPAHILSDSEILAATRMAAEFYCTYKHYSAQSVTQIEEAFKNNSAIEVLTTRPKGENSIYTKLTNKAQTGELNLGDLEKCKSAIADAYGSRIQVKSLSPEDVEKTVSDFLKENDIDCTYKDFNDYIHGRADERIVSQLKDRMDIIIESLKERQTNAVVDGLVDGIISGKISITELNNYGSNKSTYFTPKQIEKIADAYNKKTGGILKIVSRKEDGYSSPWYVKKTDEGVYDMCTSDTYEISAKNSEKPSGYTSSQMNVTFNFNNGEKGLGELQIRGVDVNRFGDVEHIPYDISKGKIKIDNVKYSTIYNAIKNMSAESMAEYNKYTARVFNALRLRELGLDTTIPKLEGNFVDKNGKVLDISCLSYESLLKNFTHK